MGNDPVGVGSITEMNANENDACTHAGPTLTRHCLKLNIIS
jgi:hypothetical protein